MNKKKNIIQTVLVSGIIIVVGFLSSWSFAKFDLTQEQRHTLTDANVSFLENMESDFHFKCYLHGDFPAKFKRLESAIKERLDEFSDYSDGRVTYEFINPYEGLTDAETREMEDWLYKQGMEFTRLSYDEAGVKKFSNIWPGVMIYHKERELPLMLFKSNLPEPTEEMVNTSINNLEYELTSAMRTMQNDLRKTIAIIEGHGELEEVAMIKFQNALKELYDVERLTLNGNLDAISLKADAMKYRANKHDALIIAKPTQEIPFQDRVLIDQFIMNGGKVLWLIDAMTTDLDSLRANQFTHAVSNETGLNSQLFSYGARLNKNILVDYHCGPIAMDAGPSANHRGMELFRWYFAPLVKERITSHPISSNLDDVFIEFAGSIDLVGEDPEISKKVLLSSGELSKAFKSPVRISPDVVTLDKEYFEQNSVPNQTVAVLLEGKFKSAFANRIGGEIKDDPTFGFREIGTQNKMIVVSDGDIAKNSYKPDGKGGFLTYPLGYDKYADAVIYDNSEFLMNAMNYLLDDDALISMRSRNIELRKLNAGLILGNKFKWQIINVILPLLLICIIGLVIYNLRKRKYSKAHK